MLDRLKKLVPAAVKSRVKDAREDWMRAQKRPMMGDPRFGLEASQIYPYGRNFDASLRLGMSKKLAGLRVTRDTPVASIGSCFAEEFAAHMRAGGYNYVMAEPDAFASSANWGRVYTTACLRQIAAYTADSDYPVVVESSPKGWFDPLREYSTPYYETETAAREAVLSHRAASREAIRRARLLTVTLGQNEAWEDSRSGLAWARIPPKSTLEAEPGRFRPRDYSFEENRASVVAALADFRKVNAELDFLITVSPVAAHATFCDEDVVTRSFAAKCLLRAVADRVVRETLRCWYFPSFELALAYNPHSFNADNRHVKRATVARIFGLLRDCVVR
jgi:hypothetical protein